MGYKMAITHEDHGTYGSWPPVTRKSYFTVALSVITFPPLSVHTENGRGLLQAETRERSDNSWAIENTYGRIEPSSKTTSKWVNRSLGRHDRRSMMMLFVVILSGMAIFAVCLGIRSLPAPAFHERKQRPLCAHVASQKVVNETSIQLLHIEIK